LRQLEGERIHRAASLKLYSFDREMLGALVARLDRRTAFSLSVTDRHLFITIGNETLSGAVELHALGGAA
jgi:hypothetical protein